MNLTVDDIIKALTIAVNAHDGQKYGDQPYIVHPIGVAQLCVDYGYNDPHYIVTALLHDVVEDSSYTVEDIEELFNDSIGEAVSYMTKPDDVPYGEYLELLCENDIAKVVKFFDVMYNHKISGRNTKKYRKAYDFLKSQIR